MGSSQPFMYSTPQHDDWRFPVSVFDPKAYTRASWEPEVRKPQEKGPYISVDRHPDAHLVLPCPNETSLPLGPSTLAYIRLLHRLQLLLRGLELGGAAGVLVLMILMTDVETAVAWIMKITPGLSIAQCTYAIYHLCRHSSGRTPASSAAYHVFASIWDLIFLSFFAFGAFYVHARASSWGTRLGTDGLKHNLTLAIFYLLIVLSSVHSASLSISCWLGFVFRKISLMAPDMNPFQEDSVADQYHNRNKTPTAATSIDNASDASENCDRSRTFLDLTSKRKDIPFISTRVNSSHTVDSSQIEGIIRQPHISTRTYYAATTKRDSFQTRPSLDSALQCQRRDSCQRSPDSGRVGLMRAHDFAVGTRTLSISAAGDAFESEDQKSQYLGRSNCSGRRHMFLNDCGGPKQWQFTESFSISEHEYEDETAAGLEAIECPDTTHPNPLGSHPPRHELDALIDETQVRAWAESDYLDGKIHKARNNGRRLRDNAHSVKRLAPEMSRPRLRIGSKSSRETENYTYNLMPQATSEEGRKVSSGNDYQVTYS